MAIPASLILYQVNDQFIEVSGLVSSLDAADFFNAASVKATLRDSEGNVVTGIDNLTLSYVPSSNGIYRGQVPETVSPALGGGYVLQISATEGTATGNWFVKCKVKIRRS